MKRLALVTIIILTASATQAKDVKQTISFGAGKDSCGSYVFALSEDLPLRIVELAGKQYTPMAGTFTQWAAGAITQQNISVNSEAGQIGVDLDGVALWLKNYCEKNPSQPLPALLTSSFGLIVASEASL